MAKRDTVNESDVVVKRTSAKGSKGAGRSTRDEQPQEMSVWGVAMWIVGLLISVVGLFVLAASLSYLFNWKNDCSAVSNPDITVQNFCGSIGHNVANAIVANAFGLFGLLVPVIMIVLGVRFLRRRLLWFDHTVITLTLVMILGSLTLGQIWGPKSEIFYSGLGGAFSNVITEQLVAPIGSMGIWIVIVVGWILTGVFVNRRVIQLINGLGKGVVEQGEHIADKAKTLITRRGGSADEEGADEAQEPAEVDKAVEESDLTETEEPYPFLDEPTDEPIVEVEETVAPEESVAPEVAVATEEPTEEGKEEQPKSNIPIIEVTETIDPELSDKETDRRPFDPDHTWGYKYPSVDLLEDYASGSDVSDDEIRDNKHLIEETLGNFGIPIRDMSATIGPTVTLYEIVQEPGVKISRIQSLANDITQSLRAAGIRMIAPMPERGTIGIEVPNRQKAIVSMRSAIRSQRFQDFDAELPVVIGRNIRNENFVFDLAKMPHLLVAGATGMGKSVGLNAILTSLLYRKDPSQLKLVLIDPKMVEFSLYAKLEKHFLAKMASEDDAIVTDPKKAVYTLHSLCAEMEARLAKCRDANVRNIKEYNDLVRKCKVEEREIMPYIVVVIDEFADLIMTAKEVEFPVMRLAQKARAVGIHLIVATQRPSVDVITGRIKANFPARIAFRVMQMIDSRTIIDQPGAEKLIGRGDMLLSKDGEITRIQCALVETREVSDIVASITKQPSPNGEAYELPDYEEGSNVGGRGSADSSDLGSESGAAVRYDSLFADIARDAVSGGQISVSHIQRNYEVGFNRAGRIMMQLEKAGIVGPQNGAKPREIRFYDMPSLEARLQELGV